MRVPFVLAGLAWLLVALLPAEFVPAPAPDQGGDTSSGDGGGDGGGGGGGDGGGGDQTGPGAPSGGDASPPPSDGGDISIGDPGITDPSIPVTDPGLTGTGDAPPPEPDGGPIPEPAPPPDTPTDVTTVVDTGTDTTTTTDTTIGGVQTGVGIVIVPPPIGWPLPAPGPVSGDGGDFPPEPQPGGDQGGDFPPEPPPGGGDIGGIGTPLPAPGPPVTVSPPGRGTTTVTGTGRGQTTVTVAPTPVALSPIFINVIEPQPEAAGPPVVQPVQLVGQPIEVTLPGLERITSDLQGTLAQFATDLTAVAQRISDDIHTQITELEPASQDIARQGNDLLSALTDDFETAFPNAGSIAAGFTDAIAANWGTVQPQIDTLLSGALGDGIMNAITGIAAGGGGSVSGLLDKLPGGDCVSALVKGFLAPLAIEGLLSDGLAVIFGLADILRVFIDASLAGPVELVKQDSMACAVPSLLSPSEANEALLRRLIDEPYARDQLHKAGFDETRQTALLGLARRLLERDDILALWLRGSLEDADRDNLLAQLGYTDTERPGLIELANLLPTPTDLIQWMLRDLFPAPIASVEFDAEGNASFTESSEPINFVDAFGMDLEFPQGSLELFKKLGISEEFAHRYWQAHWELPSPQQGAEMFQRGFITEQAFTRLLRARGVEPYWRKPFREIIYNPITRVDIRRIHKLLGKDHDWLVRSYRNIGYSPDDAEQLAEFTEKLNSSEGAATKLNEVTSLKTEIEGLYLDGFIDANTATEQLVQLGFPRDHVAAYVAGATLKREAALARKVAAAVKQLYITLHWDYPTAAAALSKEGFTTEAQARLFEEWDLDRDYRELTAEEKAHKELTKGEILSAFGDGLVNGTTATEMLAKLHYPDDQIALMLELENLKVAKSNASAVIESVHARFMAGQLDRAGAVSELDAAAVNHVRREGLLARWQLELDKKQARLTISQIQQLTTERLITPDDAAAELHREGYSQHDADLLLKLFGATATAVTTREAATAQRQQQQQQRQTAHGLTVQQIEATFKDGVLTEQGARDYLAELGYRQQPIDQLIRQWKGGL